jgi:hypothetical protein
MTYTHGRYILSVYIYALRRLSDPLYELAGPVWYWSRDRVPFRRPMCYIFQLPPNSKGIQL